jgi:hypothetical protein
MLEIDLQSALTTNIVMLGALNIEAYGDRIIVVEDEFRSGYECASCDGSGTVPCFGCNGKGSQTCGNCKGSGESSLVPGAKCTQCKGDKVQACYVCNGSRSQRCPGCDGKGGLLVVPEASARRPTTGTVVSLGWRINNRMYRFWAKILGKKPILRGVSVMYTSFSGHVYELETPDGGQIVLRVIQDSDIISLVSGHLELRRVKKSQALGTAA